jgi:hypothetical protein
MTFEEIKAAVLSLDDQGKRRVVQELLPAIWPAIVADGTCLKFLRKLVDEEAVRQYKEEHMDSF